MADLGSVDLAGIAAVHKKILENFPDKAWFLNEPELARILIDAVVNEYSPDVVASKFASTQWYLTRSDSGRQWDALKITQPETANQRIKARAAEAFDLGRKLGVTNLEDIDEIAELSLREGWNTAQLQDFIGLRVRNTAGTNMKIGSQSAGVRSMAQTYGIRLSEAEILDYSQGLILGEIDEADLQSNFLTRSRANFPHLSDLIDKGVLPGQYFEQHRQLIARAIEQPPESIDLFGDPRWNQVVSHADGGKVRPMTLGETNTFVRSTEEFGNGRTGQSEGAAFAQGLARMMGKKRG